MYMAGREVARHFMATSASELLSTLRAPGHAVGWDRDFGTPTIETTGAEAAAIPRATAYTSSA
jgi:hypothetical protein